MTPATLLGAFDFSLDTAFVFRDNLSCDHMVAVTDCLSVDASFFAADRLLQVFSPRFAVRECGVCADRNATRICLNSPASHRHVVFVCDRCFADLHCDEAGLPKTREFTALHYVYEER